MGVGADPLWPRVRAVVFDLDGTLYDQRRLRRRMLARLALHLAARPRDLALPRRLATFRRLREALAEEEVAGIGRLQYERPARALGIAPEALRADVVTWMHRRPLDLLAACRAPGADRLFRALRTTGRRVAVLSDYPAAEKLRALCLEAEPVVSAEDPEVDRLKPHPRGLEVVLERLGLGAAECVMIGDRDERDGACARRLGMPFLRKVWREPVGPGEIARLGGLAARLDPAGARADGAAAAALAGAGVAR